MSGHRSAVFPVEPPAPATADAPTPDLYRRTGRPIAIVLTTVLAWNALGLVILWTLAMAADRLHPPVDSEDWTGVMVGIVLVFTTIAILLSAAIELAIVAARAGKPDRLPVTTSTRRAVMIGTHAAAWVLLVILAFPCWALISMLINGFG